MATTEARVASFPTKADMRGPAAAKRQTRPRQWTYNLAYYLVSSVLAIVALTYITAAIYYITTQWIGFIHWLWHKVPDAVRHTVRAVWEGYMAGLGQQFVTFNYFRKHRRLYPHDRFEIKHGVPNLKDTVPTSGRKIAMAVLIFGVTYGAVPAVGAYFIGHWLGTFVWVQHSTQWLAQLPVVGKFALDWQYKLVGFVLARAGGRRVPLAVFADVYERLADLLVLHRVKTGRRPWWVKFLPPRFVELYLWRYRLYLRGVIEPEPSARRARNTAIVLVVTAMVILALLGYGIYILKSVARHAASAG